MAAQLWSKIPDDRNFEKKRTKWMVISKETFGGGLASGKLFALQLFYKI